jgi:phage terminase large subunit GpA-like protein
VDLDKTPYLYEILDSLMPDNGIEKVVLQKGWQTGGTLSALALCLWCFENSGSPVLYVFPNDELRTKFSKERLGPIIANCSALQGKVKELERYGQAKDKTRDTIITKQFPNGAFCNLATSLSPVSLRASSIQIVIFDEVSAFCDDAAGEGDPCTIALGRTSTYEGRKKLFYISTPSLKDQCRIEREYLTTDRRKYFVPCLSCGEMQIIAWKQIDFSGTVPFFRCVRCNYRHWEEDKTLLLKHGQWRPTATSMFDNTRGYFLPALYAPVGMYSWKSCAEQFRKGCDNPAELKVFVNNILAETWEDRSVSTLNPDDLANLVEDYNPSEVLPKGAALVVAGIDTHPSHVNICTRAFGRHGESWVLDYWVIFGDSNQVSTWQRVDEKLATTYRHQSGELLRIAATACDTAGHNTDSVYNFCRNRLGEFIIPIKGTGAASAPIIDHPTFLKEENIYLFRVGKLATHGRLFSDISRSLASWKAHKECIKNGIVSEHGGPQILHFHKGLDPSFFKEVAAPKAKWVKREGSFQLVYESTDGVADHAHDCLRYADAARHFLDINIERLCDKLDGAAA